MTATPARSVSGVRRQVIVVIGLVVARRTVGGQRAALLCCPQHVLRPILLRMDRYALNHGTVIALSLGGRPVSCAISARAVPGKSR